MNNVSKMIGVAVILALILAVIMYISQGSLTNQTVNVSEVNEAEDLDTVESQLDEEDLDAIDSELNAIDEDSYSF